VVIPAGIGSTRLVIMIVFAINPTTTNLVTVESSIYIGNTLHTINGISVGGEGVHATIFGGPVVGQGQSYEVSGRLAVTSGSKSITYTAKMVVMTAKR